MDNKKIIVLCSNYESEHVPRQPDPEERFYTYGFGSSMGRNLKKFCPDYAVEVWRLDAYTDKYYESIVQNVKFRVFPSIKFRNLLEFSLKFRRKLKKEIRETDPLLVITHTHYSLTYMVLRFCKQSRIVTTHHGEWSPFYRINKTKGIRKLKARFDMMTERKLFKYIDYIFTSDLNQLPYLRSANPDFKYFLWSTGVNFENMIPIPRLEVRKELGWNPDKKYILYVGKLYKFKQADDLIRIWQEIKKIRPEIELVVIGNTPGDPWEEFYDMAVGAGAVVLGRVLNKDLNKYYSAADVYVLMALRDDYFGGTGVATLESLACGTPVVSYALRNYTGDNVSEIGEMPDTLEKYKDAILKVIDYPENYKNMRNSMEEQYSYEAIYLKAKTIFDKLFEEGNKKQKNKK